MADPADLRLGVISVAAQNMGLTQVVATEMTND